MKRITQIFFLVIFCCSWHGNAQVLNESFDSPTFPSGWTYLMKVSIDGNEQTYRLLKK